MYNVYKEQRFNTTIKLKLIRKTDLNLMFSDDFPLTLGTPASIAYKVKLLREESPLVTKSKSRPVNSVGKANKTQNQVSGAIIHIISIHNVH